MLRGDLEAAGLPYVVHGSGGPEYRDFHSLRHSYLTFGGRSGIGLRTLQELAGHSKPELTARYTHQRTGDLAQAVSMLPNLVPDRSDLNVGAMKATGTDGSRLQLVCNPSGQNSPRLATTGHGEITAEFAETIKKALKNGNFDVIQAGFGKRGRRDSNPQPPDRQRDLPRAFFGTKSPIFSAYSGIGEIARVNAMKCESCGKWA